MDSGKAKAAIQMLGPVTWIAFAAGLQLCGAFLFFQAPIDLILVATGTIITFSVYLLNRFTDDEDCYNCPEQKILFQQKPILISIPITLLIMSFLLLSFTGGFVNWDRVLIICGIFYSVSFIPVFKNKSIRFIRLKDVFFLKNILVSLLWGITPFALAVSYGHILPPKNDFVVVILAFFITALINSTSGDVRDIMGDRIAGIVTFANFIGKKYTALCLSSMGVLGCVLVGINNYEGHIGKPATILFFATVLWSGIVAAPIYINKLHLPKIFSEPLIDSQVVFNGIALIILSV
jgi:4-hydroxybenzoate polyprenyltransferase